MKILSLSLGLAAIALASAQQADPMAAPGAQTTYEWASSGDQNELVAQLEELSYQVSEQALRIQFLSGPDVAAPKSVVGDQFSVQGPVCDNVASIASTAIDNTLELIKASLGSGLGAQIGDKLNIILNLVKDLLDGITGGGPLAAVAAMVAATISATINTAINFVRALSFGPLSVILTPVIDILETVKNAVRALITCQAGFGSLPEAQMFEQQSCYLLADIYRGTVADATKAFAALPTDVSEDLNRYLQGALAILENASKTSVAATNEALMATRPIFSADVLDQYRMEILRNSGDSDAVKMYAVADLGAVVAFSNGLEACLRIAADPAAAVEEANEEEEDMDEDDMDEDYEDEDEVGGEAEAADAQAQPQAADTKAQPQAADAQAQPQAADAQAQPQAADAQAQPQAADAQAQPQAA
ncbi:hypothetical protein KI688_000149 [Linnemannia hyalina]|uniref:Uncharacterized protein n=1 Tax=Linnemannia hyalina TaxID=64524 RepID=A0A9P7Y2Y6_9FUNG|nr:hypothetical protein KI688_000149 [Linnemannia hyalina]